MLKINILFTNYKFSSFWNIISAEYEKEIQDFISKIFETCKVSEFSPRKNQFKIFLGICHAD